MYQGKFIFQQLLSFIPHYEFNKCVTKYKGNHKVLSFSCWNQFLCMSFAQLTYRDSLRDIETCLNANKNKLYHLGFTGKISKSTLSYVNEKRDWHIYAEFCQILISEAMKLYKNDRNIPVDINNTVYALDSTTIDLCLSLFPWAKFRQHKGAVRLHTLLDLNCSIPSFIEITDGTVHDVNILDNIVPEPYPFYIMDRGYIDYAKLYNLTKSLAFFVIRAKDNLSYNRILSNKIDKSSGLICDQIIKLKGYSSIKKYPDKLRRIKYYDKDNDKELIFITNSFDISALTVSELYRNRWKIELFFKWIKQHLKIKTFYGTSLNAVKTQIFIAISTYVLVMIIKKKLKIEHSIYTILQLLSISIFEKVDIIQLLTKTDYECSYINDPNQLFLLI